MKEIKTIQELKDFFEKDMNGYKGCVSFNGISVYSVTDILRVIILHETSKPYKLDIMIFERVEEELSEVDKKIMISLIYDRIKELENDAKLIVNEQETKKDLEIVVDRVKQYVNKARVIDSYDISEVINELKNKL